MKTIGVIGLGSIGMRHAKNILALGHQVVGFDPQIVGDGFPTIWPFNLHRTDDLDAVIVASPTESHFFYWANLDHPILVEKPIADDTSFVADELEARDDLPLMVGNNLRFHPCVRLAKQWLREGKIGRPLWGCFTLAQYNNKPAYMRDGVTLNWGAHEIDLAMHLLGPAEVKGANINEDDTIANILLRHDSGIHTTIHLDYVTVPEVRDFRIVGTGGAMECNLLSRSIRAVDNDLLPLGQDRFHTTWDDDYVEEMKAFLDLIDGNTVPHAATGQDGLATLEIILKAKEMAGIA